MSDVGTLVRVGKSEAASVTEPRIRLGKVIVRGSTLKVQVAEAVTDASISWATDQVTELSLTIEDPGFKIWKTAQFTVGTLVVYKDPPTPDLKLRISAIDLGPGTAGRGGFTVRCRSEGAWKLKRRVGPLVMPGASPSKFVEQECKAVGLKAVCQPSATRTQVARDVPKEGETQTGSQKPSSWTTFQRLASELGYYVFEYAGVVAFGQPTWLIDFDRMFGGPRFKVLVPTRLAEDERYASLQVPSIALSEDAEVPVEMSGIELHRSRWHEARPGRSMEVHGLQPFTTPLMVTTVSMPLLGAGSVSLAASTPINPPPQPPEEDDDDEGGSSSSGGDSSSSGAATQSGTKSALDFVNVAMQQGNARYVFGAEARTSDPSPNAFDCSELIEWSLARVGVKFVDGSANQIAACRSISVAQALKTRGALLYLPGHIGISLGDGRTMEARNSRVGVGVFRAADIKWTRGGLVPGLRYG